MAKKNSAILIYEELCKIDIPTKSVTTAKPSKPLSKHAQKKSIAKVVIDSWKIFLIYEWYTMHK